MTSIAGVVAVYARGTRCAAVVPACVRVGILEMTTTVVHVVWRVAQQNDVSKGSVCAGPVCWATTVTAGPVVRRAHHRRRAETTNARTVPAVVNVARVCAWTPRPISITVVVVSRSASPVMTRIPLCVRVVRAFKSAIRDSPIAMAILETVARGDSIATTRVARIVVPLSTVVVSAMSASRAHLGTVDVILTTAAATPESAANFAWASTCVRVVMEMLVHPANSAVVTEAVAGCVSMCKPIPTTAAVAP